LTKWPSGDTVTEHATPNTRRPGSGRWYPPGRASLHGLEGRLARLSGEHTWVMLVGNEFPIRRRTQQDQQRPPPDPSHTNSNRDSTNKGSRCTRHTGSLKPDWPEGTPTKWSAHPRSPTISHDTTAHESAPFLALRARRQSPLVLVVLDALRPPTRRSLRRTQAPLIAYDCL